MAIRIDPVTTHTTANTADDTVPPGVTGLDWCHVISDASELELTTFLTANILTIGCLATNVRTPLLGANMTYAGLVDAQRTAAIAAGATSDTQHNLKRDDFDSPGFRSTWEP
jgi:hypothetical protein